MQIRTSIVVLTTAFICGCASVHSATGSGDVGQFILREVELAGGVPIATNGLPPISEHWHYRTYRSWNGVEIDLPAKTHETVQRFLHQSLGQPKWGPAVSKDGDRGGCGYILATNPTSWLAFSYICSSNQTKIVIASRRKANLREVP